MKPLLAFDDELLGGDVRPSDYIGVGSMVSGTWAGVPSDEVSVARRWPCRRRLTLEQEALAVHLPFAEELIIGCLGSTILVGTRLIGTISTA